MKPESRRTPIILLETSGNHGTQELNRITDEINAAFPESRKYLFGPAPEGNPPAPFARLNGENIISAVQYLTELHPGKSLFRIHSNGRFLPGSLLQDLSDFHAEK